MIEICEKSLSYSLRLIFDALCKEKKYPELWKKPNIVYVHKKENKNFIRNYRKIGLSSNIWKNLRESNI